MIDKNGIEMKTGDIVKVSNAYFKNDNGVYFIEHSPGDASWCGNDHCLKKICNNGKLSTASHNLAFWSLSAFTSNKAKNAECRAHNKEHATIEIIHNINNSQVIEYFKEESSKLDKQIKRQSWDFGEDSPVTLQTVDLKNHYIAVVERLSKTEEPEVKEAEQVVTVSVAEEKEKTKETTIVRKYFPINESLANSSRQMWSFSDYQKNSETNSYKNQVDKVYKIVEKIKTSKPHRIQEAEAIAERYSKKHADWINKGFAIEVQCPSVMICGAGNFPIRKKEKQNRARDKHQEEYKYINGYIKKLESILYGTEIIKSGDADAIEKLQEKLEDMQKHQAYMKELNAYYKKNNTCVGFQDFTEEKAKKLNASIQTGFEQRPFPSYKLTNNNANIKNTKDRIASLQKEKEKPTQEITKTEVCKVIENTEIMRIQLIFDGKPDEQTRSILKSNGFRWAPSNNAWQRQLTNNARYSTKKAIEQIEALQA